MSFNEGIEPSAKNIFNRCNIADGFEVAQRTIEHRAFLRITRVKGGVEGDTT